MKKYFKKRNQKRIAEKQDKETSNTRKPIKKVEYIKKKDVKILYLDQLIFQKLDIDLRIGKNGINDNIILALNEFLRKKNYVKVKFLKTLLDNREMRDALIEEIRIKTNSTLFKRVGNIFVLFNSNKIKKREF